MLHCSVYIHYFNIIHVSIQTRDLRNHSSLVCPIIRAKCQSSQGRDIHVSVLRHIQSDGYPSKKAKDYPRSSVLLVIIQVYENRTRFNLFLDNTSFLNSFRFNMLLVNTNI